MRHFTLFTFMFLLVLLTGCVTQAAPAEPAGSAAVLLVSGGETSQTFTRTDLEALPITQATFNDVTYTGVTVTALIQAAGFDPAQVKAIKAVASDGFTVNYDTNQVLVDEVIVAYARADGDLIGNDGNFRMVLPGEEGKLNVRMLIELQVIR